MLEHQFVANLKRFDGDHFLILAHFRDTTSFRRKKPDFDFAALLFLCENVGPHALDGFRSFGRRVFPTRGTVAPIAS